MLVLRLLRLAGFLFLLGSIAGANAVRAQAIDNDRALIEASAKGDLARVEKLLSAGAGTRARDARGRTALLAATHGNHVGVARRLIAAGADVNAKDDIEDSTFHRRQPRQSPGLDGAARGRDTR